MIRRNTNMTLWSMMLICPVRIQRNKNKSNSRKHWTSLFLVFPQSVEQVWFSGSSIVLKSNHYMLNRHHSSLLGRLPSLAFHYSWGTAYYSQIIIYYRCTNEMRPHKTLMESGFMGWKDWAGGEWKWCHTAGERWLKGERKEWKWKEGMGEQTYSRAL